MESMGLDVFFKCLIVTGEEPDGSSSRIRFICHGTG